MTEPTSPRSAPRGGSKACGYIVASIKAHQHVSVRQIYAAEVQYKSGGCLPLCSIRGHGSCWVLRDPPDQLHSDHAKDKLMSVGLSTADNSWKLADLEETCHSMRTTGSAQPLPRVFMSIILCHKTVATARGALCRWWPAILGTKTIEFALLLWWSLRICTRWRGCLSTVAQT